MSKTEESLSSSQKLLTNLRHFRFQKKSSGSINGLENNSKNDSSGENEVSSKQEIILKTSVSSDSNQTSCDESNNPGSSPNKNAVSEIDLKTLKDLFPSHDSLVIERTLIKCKGDVNAAKLVLSGSVNCSKSEDTKETGPVISSASNLNEAAQNEGSFRLKLFENFNKKCLNNKGLSAITKLAEKSSPVKRTFNATIDDSSPIQKTKKFKKTTSKLEVYEENIDSDDDVKFSKRDNRVFDSDEDSDCEIDDNMNADQKQVYDFLSTASLSELLCMPNCSQKKAEAIIDQRPFTGWKNMVEKFQEGKNLGTEILNSAQEILYTRQVVNQLMQKCSKLAVEMERAISAGTSNITVQPKLINPSLKLANYQMVGLNWLLILYHRGLNGILADEMGLGKTVQIIAFLAYLRESSCDDKNEDQCKTHLIVVPSSTMDNWKNELERWCPALKVMVYYGSMDERKMIRIQFSQRGIKEYDVILTTYNLITSTPEERKMFKVLAFNYVIFDEAHMLKNMNTQRFENLMRVNAKHRLLLTGTPLQNNLLELMSLLTFVMPEMFVKKKEYLKCLFTKNTKVLQKNSESSKDSLPRFEQEQVAQAKKIMQPFVLRRLKKDVLKDLPEKKEKLIYCEMVEKQMAKYKNLISKFSEKADKIEDSENEEELSGLSLMMDLRKLSNHPLLMRDLYDDVKINAIAKILAKERDYKETNIDYIKEDLSVLSDFQIHSLCKSFTTLRDYQLADEDIVESGKFRELDKLLPELQEQNHRVLIFSQFVIMLNVIEEYLNIRGYEYLRLDGSTQVIIRQELINTFNQNPSIFIFILSTRAGGLGINLTAADTVIIHDIDFNPYNDKQAEDRCHRVGQTRPVSVIKFISKDSVEENIYQVALEKLSLEREISSEAEGEHSEMKSVVSLLKKTLGVDTTKASPQKKPPVK